jgi:hypothetical protein
MTHTPGVFTAGARAARLPHHPHRFGEATEEGDRLMGGQTTTTQNTSQQSQTQPVTFPAIKWLSTSSLFLGRWAYGAG